MKQKLEVFGKNYEDVATIPEKQTVVFQFLKSILG